MRRQEQGARIHLLIPSDARWNLETHQDKRDPIRVTGLTPGLILPEKKHFRDRSAPFCWTRTERERRETNIAKIKKRRHDIVCYNDIAEFWSFKPKLVCCAQRWRGGMVRYVNSGKEKNRSRKIERAVGLRLLTPVYTSHQSLVGMAIVS